MSETAALLAEARRQHAHWTLAIRRLEQLDDIASPRAWSELERYCGVSLRAALSTSVQHLARRAAATAKDLARGDAMRANGALQRLRRAYLRTETMIDFFADAINTRTNRRMARLLGGIDWLATESMATTLRALCRDVPPVLTYVDKGLGASILKAGLRLWDGSTENPVAAIKIVRHNLLRPTAVVHEAGHQVAHILGWNDELAAVLESRLPGELGETWAGWSSEIAADALAFAHTGFAAVAALHDVVDGGAPMVFLFRPGDPHPISYVRVLLGVEMCRRFYGRGPWDDLARAWVARYPLRRAPLELRSLVSDSLAILPDVAALALEHPLRAFGGRALSDIVDPGRVAPRALIELERLAGSALHHSPHWLRREGLRLLALTGLRFATNPTSGPDAMGRQLDWILGLGDLRVAA